MADLSKSIKTKLVRIPTESFNSIPEGSIIPAKAQKVSDFRDGSSFVMFQIGEHGLVQSLMSNESVDRLRKNEEVELEFSGVRDYASGSYPIFRVIKDLPTS